jgi:hypothetical protein
MAKTRGPAAWTGFFVSVYPSLPLIAGKYIAQDRTEKG